MGVYSTKSRWQRALRPVVAFCVKYRIHPDVFTYGAIVLSVAAGAAFLFAADQPAWLWVVPPFVLSRLLFNLMDGLIARELKLADNWGEVKNEFGDRVADAAVYLGLVFGGYVNAQLAALAILLILLVSYLGILGKALGGERVYRGVFAKGDRMITLALFTFYPIFTGSLQSFNWYLLFASFAAFITILQRLRVIHGHSEPV